MNLTEEQKSAVSKWIAEEVSLSEIQRRLASEYKINITYMEARLLLSELNLVPAEKKKEEPVKPAPPDADGQPPDPQMPDADGGLDEGGAAAGGVNVSIDRITKPSAMISGKVTFSDGVNADWMVDSMGRLALNPDTPGYRPSPEDITAFQMELQRLAGSQGF